MNQLYHNNNNLFLIRLNFSSKWMWPDALYYFCNSSYNLLSTYNELPYLFSLNQSFLCFLQLVHFTPFSVYLFTFFTHFTYHWLHQNIFLRSSPNMTIPPHIILPFQLICCFLQTQYVHQLLCISLVHQLYTKYRPHHRFFCSSQNSYFIFSQTPRFASYNIAVLK